MYSQTVKTYPNGNDAMGKHKKPVLKTCKNCELTFAPRKWNQDFHSETCQQQWHYKERKRLQTLGKQATSQHKLEDLL